MSWQTELEKRMKGFENKVAKVGWLETAKYPDGKPVAEVALIHELGAPAAGIPARPFIKKTINAKRVEWTEQFKQGVQAVMRGAIDADQVLEIMGQKTAGDVRATLASGDFLKLSPITLMLRKWRDEDPNFKVNGAMVGAAAQAVKEGEVGSSRTQPLHDTGYMIATLTSVTGATE